MRENEAFYRMLGLAARGRNIASGEGAAMDSIRNKSARLVILSADASENTAKKFKNSCEFYSVPCISAGDRYELGRAIGKGFAVVIAVNNEGLAKKICELSGSGSCTL